MLGDEQMKRLFIFLLAIICLFLTKNVWAANYIYVSGASIGIKLNTDVEVLGTFGVNTENDVLKPWDNLIYEHDILKTENYNVVCKSIHGALLGVGYGYCLHYCFSNNFDKSKCNDMEKYLMEEILAHTREGAKEISELDILYMLGLV